jgi:hypothetical protein
MSLLPAEEVGSQQVAAKNGNKYDASVGIAFITLRSKECKELPLWAGTGSFPCCPPFALREVETSDSGNAA